MAKRDKSMLPFISPSDKVIVSKSSRIQLDNIVAFKDHAGKIVAHRTVYVDPNNHYLITKGDNNLKSDGKILKTQILGVVEKIERSGHEIKLDHLYLTHSSTYLSELKEVVHSLNAAKVSHIVLKGPPVHIFIDNKPVKRLYLDTDILVKKKDFQKAQKELLKLDYIKAGTKLFGKEKEGGKQTTFVKDIRPFSVVIDLHKEPALSLTKLSVTDKLLPDIEKLGKYLFSNIRSVKADGTSFKILNPNALLIFLLLHFYHHNFQGSYRAYAIKNLIKNKKINWKRFSNDINNLEVKSFIYPSLLVLRKGFQVGVPRTVFEKIEAKKIFSNLFSFLVNPFNAGSREIEGAKRFIYLLMFSNKNVSTKLEVIFSKEVIKYFFLTLASLFSFNRSKK